LAGAAAGSNSVLGNVGEEKEPVETSERYFKARGVDPVLWLDQVGRTTRLNTNGREPFQYDRQDGSDPDLGSCSALSGLNGSNEWCGF
jgi:hypothetical protein